MGRFHCGTCGKFVMKELQEYPEGNEEIYVCIPCFSSGLEAWIPVEVAEIEYPDWNRRWREEIKKRYPRRRRRR